MRKHDLTNKKTTTKTKTKTMTKTMAMTNTFREHLQRAIFETFDLWGIWSEYSENMTWPTIRQLERQWQRQWQRQIHLERPLRYVIRVMRKHDLTNNFREHPKMAIPEKFWVWPLIHCYEFRPFQTKLMGGWPNFTISLKFYNPGIPWILGVPGVRAVSQFLRCLE